MSTLPTESQLDLDYLHNLHKIKPYITCIINTHYIGLIKQWLEKLSHEEFCDRHLRNMYLVRLGKQIESGILEEPFIKPPCEGPLGYFSDDDTEPFYAAKEVLSSQTIFLHRPQDGQGDGFLQTSTTESENKLKETIDEDDCNSWMDCSELDSTQFSDFKEERIERLTKMIEQLRYENNQLMAIVNKNPDGSEIGSDQGENNKVAELQKQLANAMLRNVELQKSVQSVREMLEKRDNDAVELYKQELEILKEKFECSINKREELRLLELQMKSDEYKKKHAELQKSYNSKFNAFTENKNTEVQQTITEMREQMEVEYAKKQQQFEENRIKELEVKYAHYYKDKGEASTKTLEEIHCEHHQQLETLREEHRSKIEALQTENQQKLLAQIANYRKLIEEDRSNYQELIKERRLKWRKDMTEQNAEHQKLLEQNRKTCQKEIEDVRVKYHAKFDDQLKKYKRINEQCQELKRQNEELRVIHENEVQKRLANEKDMENQLVRHRAEAEQIRTKQQNQSKDKLSGHQKIIDDIQLKHDATIKEIENKYLQLEEKWVTQQAQFKQTLETQRLHHLQKLETQRIQNQKKLEAKNKELLKFEENEKNERVKVQIEVKELTSELEKSKNECDHLKKKINILKQLIEKMETIHNMLQKEFSKKMNKLHTKYRIIYKTNKVLLTARKFNFVTPEGNYSQSNFDVIINNLEEKYKSILTEQQDAVNKENNALKLKISEMLNVMSLSQQVEFL